MRRDLRLRKPQLRRPTRPTQPRSGPAQTSVRSRRPAVVYRNEGRGYTASASHHVSKRGLAGQGLAARPQVIRAPTAAAHPLAQTSVRPRRPAVVYRNERLWYTAGAIHHEPRRGRALRHDLRLHKPQLRRRLRSSRAASGCGQFALVSKGKGADTAQPQIAPSRLCLPAQLRLYKP